jgi:hypothetical protein
LNKDNGNLYNYNKDNASIAIRPLYSL